jgi:hypothetical protein
MVSYLPALIFFFFLGAKFFAIVDHYSFWKLHHKKKKKGLQLLNLGAKK